MLVVGVHAASLPDRDGAKLAFSLFINKFPRHKKIWADGVYAGQLVEWVSRWAGWVLEIVKRTDRLPKFVVVPRRWIVERTFARLNRYRRLSKDYEQLPGCSEAMIRIALIHLMLHCLEPG